MIRILLSTFLTSLFTIFLTLDLSGQTTVVINPLKDNTLFSENNNSNGQGGDLFVGRTNNSNLRRALIQFDLSSIPNDATIMAAELSASFDKIKTTTISLHKLTTDWGEGTSNSMTMGGGQVHRLLQVMQHGSLHFSTQLTGPRLEEILWHLLALLLHLF